MRLLVVTMSAVALTGCALSMEHPTATLAEQKLDRAECRTQAEEGSKVRQCMLARGYVPASLPHEEW